MDKLKMHSMNKVDENIEKIGKLFPNCVTERKNAEGEVEYAIDFDMLRQELSSVIVEGNEERYQFTWPDKKKSILLANAPIAKTLRPCREESVDFDNTENLYIEGDNLDVLKLLQETYLGKIKMIYIDPPYNTGNDFVYNDDFAESADEYLANSGQFDEEENRLVQNTESNGRYHTDWLNMIYPRLKIAKDLLADDGFIFISIDDNEQVNLKKCCDEVFGEENLFANISWRRQDGQTNIGNIARVKEYILIYSKNPNIPFGRLPLSDKAKKDYQYQDEKGFYGRGRLREPVRGRYNYDVVSPSGIICKGPWLISETEFRKLENENLVHWPEKEGGSPRRKIYLTEMLNKGQIPNDFWGIEFGTNQRASIEVESLFNKRYFDFPKPVSLLSTIVKLGSEMDSIVLDFFSGSATAAHAIMQLNAEDGGNRKFIMVQLPEETDAKSEAFKAGYKNICEIGKERIRRAGAKIKEENGLTAQNLDAGFRVLKLDTSNMKYVYYNPADYEMSLFDNLADNIKEDRTPEDLLFQVMLDLGILLSSKIEETTISGKKVFSVADGFLYACFDENVTEDVITEIAKKEPYYFVMRDSSMASDSVATNFDQIFATYSPNTVRKVL